MSKQDNTMNFYENAKEALKKELLLGSYKIDEKLIKDISKEFAKLYSTWRDGIFELRSKQLLFAYLLAYDVIHNTQKPIALSLGCGEGKQEGFAIALKLSYTTLKKQNKKAKLLFLTATNELVMQMKDSLPLQGLEYLYTLEDEPKAQDAKKDGIYLLEFKTYLKVMLEQKQGAKYALLDGVTKIFIDEFHAFLSSSSHIKAQTNQNLLFDHVYQKSALNRFRLYKKLIEEIKTLQKDYPEIITHSPKRGIFFFNAKAIKIKGELAQAYLFSLLKEELNSIGADSYSEFLDLLDTATQALNQEAGRDYYLFSEDGNIIDYAIAEKDTAKPLLNTVYEDKLLGIFVLLKHIKELDTKDHQREFHFLLRSFSEVTAAHITPMESIELFGSKKFAVASATLKGLQKQRARLGFVTHYLQEEILLDIEDKAVNITLSKEFDPKCISIEPKSFDQIIITSTSAKKLQSIAKVLEPRAKEFEVVSIFRDYINPNEEHYQKQIATIKEQIVKNPLQKRVILAQGLGEGSNILKHSPLSSYRAKVIALEIEAIDKVTQKRYRIGTKGRAKGVFEHSVTLKSKNLTTQEINKLQNSNNIPKQIFEIETKILQEEDTIKTNYVYKYSNRRDFLKKALVASLTLSTLPNEVVKLLNKTLNANLQTNELYARDYKIPPGIAMARDPVIQRAYIELEYGHGGCFGKYNQKEMAMSMLRLLDGRNLCMSPVIKRNTPLIEPAYWYLKERYDILGDGAPISYKELKKRNPALYYFAFGIGNYIGKYVRRNQDYRYDEVIEKYFLNSIFTAAGKDEKEVEAYRKLPFLEKEKKIKEIMKIFSTYKPDPKLNQINDDYDKLLTAQWSAMWLADHYYIIEGRRDNDILINNFLEKPLRKLAKLKVRGPPFYIDY